jgi:hypothetical protein
MTTSAMITILSESYETKIRSSGVSFSQGFLRLMGVLIPFVLGLLLEEDNGSIYALIILGISFLGISILSLFLKETRPSVL